MIISTVVYCFYHIMIEDMRALFCSVIPASSFVCMTQSELIKEHQSHRLLEETKPIDYEYDE